MTGCTKKTVFEINGLLGGSTDSNGKGQLYKANELLTAKVNAISACQTNNNGPIVDDKKRTHGDYMKDHGVMVKTYKNGGEFDGGE